MSQILDAIYAARLRELAGFLALPAEQLAHAVGLVGGDPLKLQAAANLLMADGEPVPMPRGWRKDDALLWATLPAPIQQIVADREHGRTRELRLKQDEAARLRHENDRLQALLTPTLETAEKNGVQQTKETEMSLAKHRKPGKEDAQAMALQNCGDKPMRVAQERGHENTTGRPESSIAAKVDAHVRATRGFSAGLKRK
jgi:hypothetical protein